MQIFGLSQNLWREVEPGCLVYKPSVMLIPRAGKPFQLSANAFLKSTPGLCFFKCLSRRGVEMPCQPNPISV